MKDSHLKIFISTILLFNFLVIDAQKLEYDVISESSIFLKAVYNNDADKRMEVIIDGKTYGPIKANGSLSIRKECKRFVKCVWDGTKSKELWRTGNTSEEWNKLNKKKTRELKNEEKKTSREKLNTKKEQSIEKETKYSKSNKNKINKNNISETNENTNIEEGKIIDTPEIIASFINYIENIPFYSNIQIKEFETNINNYVDAMQYMDDKNKEIYIKEHSINLFLTDTKYIIKKHKDNSAQFIDSYLQTHFNDSEIEDREKCINQMQTIINTKISERQKCLQQLNTAMKRESKNVDNNIWTANKIEIITASISIIIFIMMLMIIFKLKKKKKLKGPTKIPFDNETKEAQANIIVRRKTTSILKRQSLEDVIDNPAYMYIDCENIFEDSAVRRIYLKNTCIKDIYNMYAEDLRNPDNPKEDGCMVLGRWVYDNQKDEYYVSLEEIVEPGDDAVFKEYELNFGGKIKLKVSEKLRKLRRETNLQYDMTCWVHSHPGLGVFFSNADNGVHMQLKHPTHPKFLIAIVIDILTPKQELGIFTFKHDMTINSKSDIKRMYSLEDLYKWAIESEKSTYKSENYYNLIPSSKNRSSIFYEILLSNSAIIDIEKYSIEQQVGFTGWIQGFTQNTKNHNEFVIDKITEFKNYSDVNTLGYFIIGTHRSIPSIRKSIIDIKSSIKFVLFYSTTDGTITSIPIINNELYTDENYYIEKNLEELKIWTRRKR